MVSLISPYHTAAGQELSVTPIGSCRITNPLRKAQLMYDIRLNRSGVYGYCHSSEEAVQMAQCLLGQRKIPKHIWPFLSKSEMAHAPHDAADSYVVEISSAKSITLDGWPVQLNYLAGLFPVVFGDPNVARAYWALVDAGNRSEMTTFLSELEVNQEDADILGMIRRSWADHASLVRDMSVLKDLLPTVTFVTHVNARRQDETHLPTRHALIELVTEATREVGANLYNPTEAMEFVGQAQAIADNSDGLAHYTEPFEMLVATDLASKAFAATKLRNEPEFGLASEAAWLFQAAASRHTRPDLAVATLAKVPTSAIANAVFHLAKSGTTVPPELITKVLPQLNSFQHDILWAIGSVPDPAAEWKGDAKELAAVLRAIPATDLHAQLEIYLPLRAKDFDETADAVLHDWLIDLSDHPVNYAKACALVFANRPRHTTALAGLRQSKELVQNALAAAQPTISLAAAEEINCSLPRRVPAIDLALSRAHFANGDGQAALRTGLSALVQTPDNLTLRVMLMRAAYSEGDVRAIDLAQSVIERSKDRPTLKREAERMIEAVGQAA